MTHDEKIQDVAVAYIRKHTDCPILSFTIVGARHPSLVPLLSLAEGELVLVSAFFSKSSWYAFTTRRIISQFQGVLGSIDPSHGIIDDFHNFKGYKSYDTAEPGKLGKPGVVPREIATIRAANADAVIRFECETWNAAMAPMYAARYWDIKHPFLHKLMTTAEIENYKNQK